MGGPNECASDYYLETPSRLRGDRPHQAPHAGSLSILGCPPERFWRIARDAGCPLSTVFSFAGGHPTKPGDRMRITFAARAIAVAL